MDISTLKALSDDELREELERNGYAPPPITDDAVRELMRRRLFKYLNPGANYPTNSESSESGSDEKDEGGDVGVHRRNNFGAGDTTPIISAHSNARPKIIGEQQRRSRFPIIVAVGFVILNVLLAATILYRDLLF